ncbi:TonB-dependent receptor plug domain-containing protein [Parvularcula maris]|uniref:TonB-dependent receptor n=1 Tax=Parvularcula maris TaxID=2965077 RepID=A0A9X2RJ00_9PROT|nr:TonB-dependent receptor plug domain-containing protein [Parvularcula maris]MCQ8186614.1 TonB-dependent receptor [Parvularcula maris]
MDKLLGATALGLILVMSHAAAQPLQVSQDANEDDLAEPRQQTDGDVIIVQGQRRRGVTLGTVEPELTLGEDEIEAYGASSLAELLEALAPETSSNRGRRGGGGRPLVLLNGRRISGFREIGRYPPEALARVEVLPEEAALSYGFSADQRIINFILKPNVTVKAAEGEAELPESGGTAETEGSFQRLTVDGDKRFSIDFRYEGRSPLLEEERDIVPDEPLLPFASPGNLGADVFGAPVGSLIGADPEVTVAALSGNGFGDFVPGERTLQNDQAFRTLIPESETFSLGLSRSQQFFADSVMTVSAEGEHFESDGLSGRGTAALNLPASSPFVPFADGVTLFTQAPSDRALLRETDRDRITGGLTVVSGLGRTNWTFAANVENQVTEVKSELGPDTSALQAAIDGGADPFAVIGGDVAIQTLETRNENLTASAEFILNAKTFELPAGDVTVSAQAGAFTRHLDTSSERAGAVTETELSRDTFSAQTSIDVPVFDAEDWRGQLSVNGNINLRDLSDFGTLVDWGGGFNWRPTDKLRFLASFTAEEGAPGIEELGAPVLVTPNARVFDFVTGQTVLVDVVTGGNADLTDDSRRVSKIGLQIKPFEERQFTVNFDYTQSLLKNEAQSFPALTAEIEAAFPERFTRDADGNLLSIDRRPINIEEVSRKQLQTRFSWSKRLGGGRRGGGRPSGRPPSPAAERAAPPQTERPAAQGAPIAATPQTTSQGPTPQRPTGQGSNDSGQRGRPGGGRPRGRVLGGGRPGGMGVTITHNLTIEDEVLIADGLPKLDLLNGSALGQNGGTPQHEVAISFRRWNKGLGMFVQGRWQSGTEVSGALTGGDDLDFASITDTDVRLSYDLGYNQSLMAAFPFLDNTRIAVGIDNLFDSRPTAETPDGQVPLRFQEDLTDPLGRTFEIELRKRF